MRGTGKLVQPFSVAPICTGLISGQPASRHAGQNQSHLALAPPMR